MILFSIFVVLFMKPYTLLLFSALLLAGCASVPKYIPGSYNFTVIDEKKNTKMLWGPVNREAFGDTAFTHWFSEAYNIYKPDAEAIGKLKKINDYTVTVVFGSWCSDSKDHLPHFLKVADAAGLSSDKITMIAVNRQKEDPEGKVKPLNIKLVPTFIFYRNGVELGRIVEVPEDAIEKVILQMAG